MKEYGFNTTLLHGSEDSNPHGATQVPIYQSSAFRHDTAEELEKIFANKCAGYSYTRINNPTIESFEKRMTKLEGGVGSVACSSGMAALTMALMNILRNGDHVVAAAGLYGGTVELLDELSALEKQGETDIDRMSGIFGHIMEEILAYRQDEWEKSLRRIGFYLGKFIYLLDAYDDVEEDVKNEDYNPFAQKYTMEGFEGEVRQILMMMMAETCREFEKLPIIKYGDILRNILYSGVWCRFEEVSRRRREEREKEHVGSI